MIDPTPLRPRPTPASEPSFRRIFVRDLVLSSAIGVHAHERGATQRVRINTDLLVADDSQPLHDNIENVVSYEDIVEGVREIVSAGHINLVETLAERIAELCLSDPRVDSVRVKVEKLDIYTEAASVGVEIERNRRAA